MSIDQLQAAAVLFPLEAAAEKAASAPRVAAPTPAPAAPTPAATPAPAPAEETHAAKMDKLDKAMGLGKYTPGPDGKTPADAEVDAKVAAEVKQATDAKPEAVPAADIKAAEAMLDMKHPDAAAVAPVIADLKLSQEQVGKLSALRDQLQQQQSDAWAAESERAFVGRPHDLRDAKAAIAKYGSPELKAVLNSSGLGNHPALIKAFAQAFRGDLRNLL